MIFKDQCYKCHKQLTDDNRQPDVSVRVEERQGTVCYGICKNCSPKK